MAKRAPKSAAGKAVAEGKSKRGSRKPPAAVRPAKSPARGAAGAVYPLKITLDHIRPPIWRRVQVKDCSLADLHYVIQTSMGWYNSHLHIFEIAKEQYGDPEQWQDAMWGHDVADEGKVKLGRLVGAGVKKFHYEYDMGDSWGHTIQVEKMLPAEAGVHYPPCVDGKRACPPEDCGGPWGYGGFLDAVQNPRNPQHEEMREWVGGSFDPEAFDLDAVNRRLAKC
ncbi:MAG TPA: plasmid pRiA4b ORF-3 family protein [Gemmataceae bacterium]|nr:plasmid pRiA4b ORF-3 family protein [Gemmataceae bacterium]